MPTSSHALRFACALLLTLLCSACAHRAGPQATAPEEEEAAAAGEAAKPAPPEEILPKVELTPEIFYQITIAEIAAQRGEIGAAYATYLQLARTTQDPRLAARAVELALYTNALNEALEAARLWQQISPNSSAAGQAVLALQISTGRLQEAEPTLMARLQTATPAERSTFYRQLPRLLSAAPVKNEALLLVDRLLASDHSDAEAQLALGQIAANAGNNLRALLAFNTALAIKPGLEPAVLMKAQLLLQQNNTEQALETLKTFLQANPAAKETRAAYARALLASKQLDAARQQFEQLIRDDPHNVQAQFALGALASEARNWPLAEQWFRRYLESAKITQDGRDTSNALIYLSQILQEAGRSAEALKLLEGIDDSRQFAGAIIRRAELLSKEKRLNEARALLQTYPARNARERNLLIMAETQLLREARQYQEAFNVLTQAIKKYPNQTDLLYEHGMAAEKLNRLADMEDSLRQVIKLRPDHAHAYNALGYSLADHNLRLKEAQALIEKAHALAPNDPAILDSMGWVQYRLGNLDKAGEYLRRAQGLLPEAEVMTHLGEVLWMQGRHEEARAYWRKAQEKEPDNEVLQSTLQRLKVSL